MTLPANVSRQQCHHRKGTGWSWAEALAATQYLVKFFFTFQSKTSPLVKAFINILEVIPIASVNCLRISFGRLSSWSLVFQQRAGVWADVIVFIDGLVQVQRLPIYTDLHTAAVGSWHQCGDQRNIWGEKWQHDKHVNQKSDLTSTRQPCTAELLLNETQENKVSHS